MCVCVICMLGGLERQDTCSASFAVSPPSIVAANDLGQGYSTWYEGRKDQSLIFWGGFTQCIVCGKSFALDCVCEYVILSGKSRTLQGLIQSVFGKTTAEEFYNRHSSEKGKWTEELFFWDRQKIKLISCLTDKQDYWGLGVPQMPQVCTRSQTCQWSFVLISVPWASDRT